MGTSRQKRTRRVRTRFSSYLVLDRLVAIWRRPGAGADARAPRVPSLQVWLQLVREFGAESVRAAAEACLRATAEALWRDEGPGRCQLFSTDRRLKLAREIPERSPAITEPRRPVRPRCEVGDGAESPCVTDHLPSRRRPASAVKPDLTD